MVDGASIDNPSINAVGDVVTVSYNHGAIFDGGDHLATLTYTEQSTPPATRTVEHAFSVPSGMVAILEDNPTIYYRLVKPAERLPKAKWGLVLMLSTRPQRRWMPSLGQERLVVGTQSTSVLFDAAAQNRVEMPDHPATNAGGPKRSAPWNSGSRPLIAGFYRRLADNMVIIEERWTHLRGINVYLQGTDNPAEAALYMNVWNRAEEFWGASWTDLKVLSMWGRRASRLESLSHRLCDGWRQQGQLVNGTVTGYLNGQAFGEVPGVHLLYNHGDDYAIGGVWTNEVMFWDEDPASNLSAVGGSS